jgi:hypothetical protein
MDLLLFLRRTKQHTSSNAAMTITASGTPTPMPIFSRLVRPASVDAGATGSAVELEVADELAAEDTGVERVVSDCDDELAGAVEDSGEGPEEDARLDVSLTLLEDAVNVGVVLKLCDSDITEDAAALVDNDSSIDESIDEAVSDGNPVGDTVTSVGNASLAGGAAVAGPNSCIK